MIGEIFSLFLNAPKVVRIKVYPYFKKSDLFVCTSVSESVSYVIAESKVLHVPVLCNDIPVAKEVVSDEEGWISSIADMPGTLSRIIDKNNGIYTSVKEKILNYRYNNHEILKKFEAFVQQRKK